MNDVVKKYLLDKYGANYEQDAQNKYSEAQDQNRIAQFGSNLGDVIAGNKVGSANEYFNNLNKEAKENTVGKIDKDREQFIKNQIESGQIAELERKNRLSDANSNESQSFRKMMEAKFPEVTKAYGDSWANVTANDQENIFRPLQLKEQIEARKEQARILAGQRADAKQQKLEDKNQMLKTPFGLANTEDDAKKLKEAYESKKNFDNKINEMIDLRKKHGGGAIMNREDVARGKQLSKDLLLEYKNMAKLGVLSQSDENIINAIIPADPLEYNSPLASLQGQDPILNNLQKFKGDSEKDFSTRVATRTRDGSYTPDIPKKEIVKTQTNQKTGQKRIVYSDGSSEIINPVARGN